MSEELARAVAAAAWRQMGELGRERIGRCLALLEEEEVWRPPGPTAAAIGNLVLHLAGNVRQWLVSGLGGAPDRRRRSEEFAEAGPLGKAELLARLDAALAEARGILETLDEATLLGRRRIQGFEELGIDAVVHVVEHFSYHVGQIAWWTKVMKETDLGFYAGADLDASNG